MSHKSFTRGQWFSLVYMILLALFNLGIVAAILAGWNPVPERKPSIPAPQFLKP